jgi:hypothetical protein
MGEREPGGAGRVGARILTAEVDVIVDQGALHLPDCRLDRVGLLGQIKARATLLHHRDGSAWMPFGALQAVVRPSSAMAWPVHGVDDRRPDGDTLRLAVMGDPERSREVSNIVPGVPVLLWLV